MVNGAMGAVRRGRPGADEFAPYYLSYLRLVPEEDILPVLASENAATAALLRGVSDEDALRRHPPHTWSVKEVVGHLIDSERVFAYRALRIARGDETPLPGFDENAYAPAGEFDRRPLANLVEEFAVVRRSSVLLFTGLPDAAWSRRGVANNNLISVRALAYCLVGHERHHMGIVRGRLGAA
jgi:hypothetical protein